jgi:hypothetical protein
MAVKEHHELRRSRAVVVPLEDDVDSPWRMDDDQASG